MGSLTPVAVRAKRELCADVSGAAREDLSAPLKGHLREQLARLGHSRLLFVKRPERRSHKRRMFYVGSCRPGEERFYALEFEHHDDLVDYDFASALLQGDVLGVPVEH